MKIIEAGHIYGLRWLDGVPMRNENRLIFLNRKPGMEHPGAQSQDVLRALIDRTQHCHRCLPHRANESIIHHLRMALALHEARALERKAEKGLYAAEKVTIGADGHFAIRMSEETTP